jgi:ribosomal protein S24E
MEIKITSDSSNALLSRREIKFYILSENATPSRDSAKAELCKKLGLDPTATIVVNMSQGFGVKRCECTAHAYKAEADLKRLEPKHIQERLVKKEKGAEQKPEAKPPKEKKG